MTRVARQGPMGRLLQIGARPDEHESAQLRRRSMTALVSLIMLLTPVWVGTYLVLGRPLSVAVTPSAPGGR